jgi:hypothetical protein
LFAIAPVKASHLGRCYELAAKRVGSGPGATLMFSGYEGATLVHGTIQGAGMPALGHAWVVEPDGESVWEPGTDTVYPWAVFVALFNAVEHVTYSTTEARRWMVKSGHYGPWEV